MDHVILVWIIINTMSFKFLGIANKVAIMLIFAHVNLI